MTQPLEYATPSEKLPARLSPWGKGFLAVAGTLLLNGLGHLLAGRPRRAAGWFGATVLQFVLGFAWLCTPVLQPYVIIFLPIVLVFSLACVVDAFLCGRRSTSAMLYHPAARYLAGLALLATGVFGQPGVRFGRLVMLPHVEGYILPTASMSPTLKPGDRFVVLKGPWKIRRWDLVAMHPPITFKGEDKETYAKRIVGLPGEKIEIIKGVVHVNGQPVSPPEPIGPYAGPGSIPSNQINGGEGNPIDLKDGEYFVVGDNSAVSADSRIWNEGAAGHQPGALPADHIIGRITAIYWPMNRCRRFE